MPDSNSILMGEGVKLRRIVVAQWLDDAKYGANHQIYGSAELIANVTTMGAERRGDGHKLLATYRERTGGTASITFANTDWTALARVLGMSTSVEGVTPDRIRSFLITTGAIPYIGLIGSVDTEAGETDAVQLFIPKMQANSDTIAVGSFTGGDTPEFRTLTIEFNVLPDDNWATDALNTELLLEVTAESGTFTLTYGCDESGDIPFDASASDIEDAIEALVGVGNVAVTVGTDPDTFNIEFINALGYRNVYPLVASAGATITVTQKGFEAEDLMIGMFEVEDGYAPALPPPYAC